jgi:FAD dependent monooxygenase
MAHEDSKRPFRVIVVGAGVVGLSLSHGLQLANIEHVVLEKQPKVVSLHGAALMIYPGCARIFDQFGILEEIQKSVSPITSEVQRWPDGTVNIMSSMLRNLTKRYATSKNEQVRIYADL